MELLVHAIHTDDPGKVSKSLRDAITKLDEEDERHTKDVVKQSYPEEYIPDEGTSLDGIDKIKSMRQSYGMQ
jgi:hypothetical protein